jgi:uncharacterized protein (DUF58 family)
MKHRPLIDQALLEKLERLTLRWQKSFPGLVGGHNSSRFPGAGQEFLDHRHFHHGDDYRAVNWRAYLRLDKLFLKMFQVEPRIPVRLLLDASDSMSTGAVRKFDAARRLAAALCYVGLVRLDTIVLHAFAEELSDPFTCGGGRHRFAGVAAYLEGLCEGGATNYLAVARDFASAYRQRGLLIIISDFLDDSGAEKPLEYLADLGHELHLIHLWAPEDREPPWEGELELLDAETGDVLRLEVNTAARQAYTAAFDDYSRSLQRVARRNGGRYVGFPADLPLEDALFGPLSRAGSVR